MKELCCMLFFIIMMIGVIGSLVSNLNIVICSATLVVIVLFPLMIFGHMD